MQTEISFVAVAYSHGRGRCGCDEKFSALSSPRTWRSRFLDPAFAREPRTVLKSVLYDSAEQPDSSWLFGFTKFFVLLGRLLDQVAESGGRDRGLSVP